MGHQKEAVQGLCRASNGEQGPPSHILLESPAETGLIGFRHVILLPEPEFAAAYSNMSPSAGQEGT